jgi:hypothetical protein
MKDVTAVILVLGVYTGVLYAEYHLAMWLGFGLLLIAGCGLILIGLALFQAPQECDHPDVVYVRQTSPRPTGLLRHRFKTIRVRL